MTVPSERITIRVQHDDFDVAQETKLLTSKRHDVGAVVTFTGLCRGEGDSLSALELEHYPGMAEKQLAKVVDAACGRWPVDGVTVIHRVGKIGVGDQIVLVLATSRHRDAAFEAARFIMDFLKTDAPFWKKEHGADGQSKGWVDAREADETAKDRWR